MNKKLIQLMQKDIKELRDSLHKKQNEICPLLNTKVPYEDMTLDHKHKRKLDPIGPNGDGLIRGSISRIANTVEGKITNACKRYGIEKYISIPSFLRNLAMYLENPPAEQIYIHPSEKAKAEKLKKRDFNRVIKYYKLMYPKRKKLPIFPKSGNLSPEMRQSIKDANALHQKFLNAKAKRKK